MDIIPKLFFLTTLLLLFIPLALQELSGSEEFNQTNLSSIYYPPIFYERTYSNTLYTLNIKGTTYYWHSLFYDISSSDFIILSFLTHINFTLAVKWYIANSIVNPVAPHIIFWDVIHIEVDVPFIASAVKYSKSGYINRTINRTINYMWVCYII